MATAIAASRKDGRPRASHGSNDRRPFGQVMSGSPKNSKGNERSWREQTRLVRGGQVRSPHGETAEALYLTSGYVYASAEEAEAALKHSIAGRIGTAMESVSKWAGFDWRTNIALSRKLVVHSTALIASGAYLVLMAGGGYLLREIDETRGPVFQVIFLVGAVAVLAISLLSGTSWAYLKQWVSRHFFQSKYDWRAEWLRFMDTLSVGRAHSLLEERAIKALADILESPGGGMWLLEDEGFVQVSRWNFPELRYGEPCEGNLVQFLRRSRRIVDLREAMADPEEYPGLIVPEELVGRREAWLVVPLWHHELVGFVVLARPRTPRSLGWEDFDLIHIVGRQIASYLSERKATQALGEAREFEIFNRRFAFVVHDIKNLVSQLSLISGNIERHGDKKAFRDDLAKSPHRSVPRP